MKIIDGDADAIQATLGEYLLAFVPFIDLVHDPRLTFFSIFLSADNLITSSMATKGKLASF